MIEEIDAYYLCTVAILHSMYHLHGDPIQLNIICSHTNFYEYLLRIYKDLLLEVEIHIFAEIVLLVEHNSIT